MNTTMAEFETYHTQKVDDFRTLAKEHLDGEIALHEQVRMFLLLQTVKHFTLIICVDSLSSENRSFSI